MLLTLVTKDGNCVYCNAKLKLCGDPECKIYFYPKSSRHKFHSKTCNMRKIRSDRKTKLEPA